MRLEKRDLDVLLPVSLMMLSKKGNIMVNNFDYLLERNAIALKAELMYAGLPVRFEAYMHFVLKNGALGIVFEKNYLDSLLMKGDILPFLKTVMKVNPYLKIENDTLIFYHPKMIFDEITIDENGVEVQFK